MTVKFQGVAAALLSNFGTVGTLSHHTVRLYRGFADVNSKAAFVIKKKISFVCGVVTGDLWGKARNTRQSVRGK